MSYKVIEKNEFGIRVRNYSGIHDCNLCKNHAEKSTCKRIECAPNSYYLPDSEVEKLETENSDTQKELIDLKIENKQLKERVNELEEQKTTKVDLFVNDGVEIFECLSCGMLFEENEPFDNYCPNCGRKIIRK